MLLQYEILTFVYDSLPSPYLTSLRRLPLYVRIVRKERPLPSYYEDLLDPRMVERRGKGRWWMVRLPVSSARSTCGGIQLPPCCDRGDSV